jgi:hypothetical protein
VTVMSDPVPVVILVHKVPTPSPTPDADIPRIHRKRPDTTKTRSGHGSGDSLSGVTEIDPSGQLFCFVVGRPDHLWSTFQFAQCGNLDHWEAGHQSMQICGPNLSGLHNRSIQLVFPTNIMDRQAGF